MKLAAYARYSSDNQRDLSIVAQLRAIKEWAKKEGHTIVKVYQDEARSATTDDRPGFIEMMRDVSSGYFEGIIVHKLDRFARDRYDAAYYRKQMKRAGVKLLSVVEHIDDTPESVMYEAIIDGMNEYYSRNLSREVMKGMKENAYLCRHTGGSPPLGYDVAPDKSYIINEKEAEAVRMIFEMYAAGEGYSPILQALQAGGYTTKAGQAFGKNSLNSILKNEKYKGVYTFNKYQRKVNGRRNSRKEKPEDEVIRIEGGIPAIVPAELWESVARKMEANKHAQAAYTAKTTYLLSGKIFCGECGSSMVGKSGFMGRNKDFYSYYDCGAKKRKKTCNAKAIGREYIEGQVIRMLRETLFDASVIDAAAKDIYEYACQRETDLPDRIVKLKAERLGVDVEIRNIVNAIASGMFHESMKDKMTELEGRKAGLNFKIEEAEDKIQQTGISLDDVKMFLSRWSDMTEPEEYKQAIKIFVERIVVYSDHFDIDIFVSSGVTRGVSPTEGRGSPPPMRDYHKTIKVSLAGYRHN